MFTSYFSQSDLDAGDHKSLLLALTVISCIGVYVPLSFLLKDVYFSSEPQFMSERVLSNIEKFVLISIAVKWTKKIDGGEEEDEDKADDADITDIRSLLSNV